MGVRHRDLDLSANAQESEAVFAGDIIERHNGLFAGIVVYTHSLADTQDIVALYQSVLLVITGVDHIIRVCTYGHAAEQRHDHEHSQQNTDEPFLHNFAPPKNYPSG